MSGNSIYDNGGGGGGGAGTDTNSFVTGLVCSNGSITLQRNDGLADLTCDLSSVVVSATAPTTPVTGQAWCDGSGTLSIWDGAIWVSKTSDTGATVTVNATAPTSPSTGDLWCDNANSLSIWNGTAWVNKSGTGNTNYVQGTAPTGVSTGDIWFDTTTTTFSIWDGTQWLSQPTPFSSTILNIM